MDYEDTDLRETFSFVAGLTLGALIGTAAALLMAPQSGRRTRRQIVRKAEEWSEAAEDTLEDVRDETRRVAERARRQADRATDRVSRAVERGRDRLRR